jgi:hypothetical protein
MFKSSSEGRNISNAQNDAKRPTDASASKQGDNNMLRRQAYETQQGQKADRPLSTSELKQLNQEIQVYMDSELPARSLDFFKQTEALFDRVQSARSRTTESLHLAELSTHLETLQTQRAQVSDALFKRDFEHTPNTSEFMCHIETNDKGHKIYASAYEMTVMPMAGMMVIGQAYHERVHDQNKVLPYTVIMRNQWTEAMRQMQLEPEHCDLKLIRYNNVTNVEDVTAAKNSIRGLPATDGAVPFKKGSEGFNDFMTNKLGRSIQRLLDQNQDIFGNKEIKRIIVEDGGANNLNGVRFEIGDREP